MTDPYRLLRRLVRQFRGHRVERYVTELGDRGRVSVFGPKLKVIVKRDPSAAFILNGELKLTSFQGSTDPIYISLDSGSRLTIDGDFEIGSGTKIVVGSGASLYIGGRRNESASGITASTRIMVYKSISIGTDFICAWGVYITDCDWHQIGENQPFNPTIIGRHVWLAPNCKILKGTTIGDNCIVAASSLVHKYSLPPDSLGGATLFES